MPSDKHAAGPLGEPSTLDYLQVLRQELPRSIGIELSSERARGLLDMVLSLLDHLIVRSGELDTALETRRCRHSAAQEALEPLTNPTARESLENSVDPDQLEYSIGQAIGLLPTLGPENRSMVLRELSELAGGEFAFLNKIDDCESGVARKCKRASELGTVSVQDIEGYLQRYARAGLPLVVKEIGSPLGGYSKDVFVVRLEGPGRPADAVVIRRDLVGGPLESSVENEFGVLKAMEHAGIPVAGPLWIETDPARLGGKLMVMKFVEGEPLTDYRATLQSGDIKTQLLQFARILAAVHSVPLESAGIGPDSITRPLARHISLLLQDFKAQWLRRREAPNPVIAMGLAWMEHNIPAENVAPVIVHGDYSMRNLLFADGQATALLDWETWHIGDPAEDLAYCREEVESAMDWGTFLAAYRAAGGVDIPAGRLAYWGFWKYLRGAITSVSMMNAVTDAGNRADIRTAFGGVFFTRYCLTKTAEHLQTLLAEPAGPLP